MAWIEKINEGVLLRLVIQPKSLKNQIVGLYGEPQRLKIKVAAQPLEGQANQELLKYLKKKLKYLSIKLILKSGESSKYKDIICDYDELEPIKSLLEKEFLG